MISHVLLLLGLSFQTCSQLLVKNFRDCITVQLSRFCLPTSRQLCYINTTCYLMSTTFLKLFLSCYPCDNFNRLTCCFLFVNMFFEKLFIPLLPGDLLRSITFSFSLSLKATLLSYQRLSVLAIAFLFFYKNNFIHHHTFLYND